MAAESTFTVPEDVSFQEAIALAQSLLDHMEQGHFSEEEIKQAIAALVATENGARGFFVTYLPDPRPFADHPTSAVIAALETAPGNVTPLMVKNLAMSTAMAIAHRRNQNQELAQGSDQVKTRSARLFKNLQSPQLKTEAQALATTLTTGTGPYEAFLARQHYDQEQQQAIHQALQATDLLGELGRESGD
jgi:hypothetical protein